MQTVLEVLKKTEAFFARAGLETPKVEAEWLLAETLGLKRLDLFLQFERPLDDETLGQLRERVRRRAEGEPLQYVIGHQDFHDIRLEVRKGALVPRPETEQLVQKVIERLKGMDTPRIIDLGTGTGAIALAIAKAVPTARVLAVDRSAEALAVARANAELLGLRDRVAFRSGDWLKGVDTQADCIVSNPPYLTEAEWAAARTEVRGHEPKEALVAADEGLADLKVILTEAKACLAPGGWVALEMGIAHGEPLKAFAKTLGYAGVSVEQDDSGRDRFFFVIGNR